MVEKRILLIDDERNLEATAIARTYDSGIFLLTLCKWDLLLLDHDLGCYDENGREMTGYDILCWLEKYPALAPKEIKLVTDNASVINKMKQAIHSIYKHRS